jgi:hypothetical protein
MIGITDLEETARWSRHHRHSPYELDVTGQQESGVTTHAQPVEMAGPADQGSAKTEMMPAVPPWMASRLNEQLETGPEKD